MTNIKRAEQAPEIIPLRRTSLAISLAIQYITTFRSGLETIKSSLLSRLGKLSAGFPDKYNPRVNRMNRSDLEKRPALIAGKLETTAQKLRAQLALVKFSSRPVATLIIEEPTAPDERAESKGIRPRQLEDVKLTDGQLVDCLEGLSKIAAANQTKFNKRDLEKLFPEINFSLLERTHAAASNRGNDAKRISLKQFGAASYSAEVILILRAVCQAILSGNNLNSNQIEILKREYKKVIKFHHAQQARAQNGISSSV